MMLGGWVHAVDEIWAAYSKRDAMAVMHKIASHT